MRQIAPFWAIVSAASLIFVTAHAYSDDRNLIRQISVSGEAELRVAPDMATLRMDVVTEAREASYARREAEEITARALAILDDASVPATDVDSTGLSINPQYEWIKQDRRQQLVGYRVTRSIEVRLLDLEKLGTLLESLSEAGVNRMHAPTLGLQDEESVYQQVLAAAASNARARADVLAGALGESVNSVISLNTESAHVPQPMYRQRAMAADAAFASESASSGESYQAGHLNYQITVHASFSLN